MRACCPSGGHRPCRGQTIPGGEEDPVTCRPESLLPGFKCLLQSLADQTGRGVGPRTFALRHSVRDSLVDGPGRDAGLGVHARRFVLAPGRDRWLCERRRADIAPQPARIRPESAGERATGTGRGQSEAGPLPAARGTGGSIGMPNARHLRPRASAHLRAVCWPIR